MDPHQPFIPEPEPSPARERTERRAAYANLTGFRFNDVVVFDGSPTDLAIGALQQAHAVAVVLSAAISETIEPETGQCAVYAHHIDACLSAIRTLMGLSAFAMDVDL